MAAAVDALRLVALAGLVVVTVATLRRWRLDGERSLLYVAVTVGALAFVVALNRISDATGHPGPLVDATIVAFACSGLAALAARHAFLPLRRGALVAAGATMAATTAIVLAARDRGPDPAVTAAGSARLAAAALLALWAACVLEPAVRFWRLSSTRPRVQRARLRGLSTFYGGVAALVVFILGVGLAIGHEAPASLTAAVYLLAMVLLPVMYVAVSPPAWLRRAWREPEEQAMHEALEDLLLRPHDSATVAERALGWAVRLLGGGAGALVDAAGEVHATVGQEADEAVALAREATGWPAPARLVRMGERPLRFAVVAPLPSGETAGALVVLSGPFTPLLGAEERERLTRYATSVAAAFERVRLTEALAAQRERDEKLLDALSDVGQGFVVVDPFTRRFRYVNRAVVEITGYSEDELLALPSYRHLFDPADAREIERRLDEAAAAAAAPSPHEARLLRADGTTVTVEISAQVAEAGRRVIALVSDVTERRRAQQAERRRAMQLATMASVMLELTRRTLEPDELLPAIAAGARLVFGCDAVVVTLTEADGQPVREATSGDPAAAGLDRLDVPLVHADRTVGRLVLMGPRDDDERRRGATFDDVDAAVAASLGVYAAEVLEVASVFSREHELLARLQAADQLKDTFLNAVSHELRTPLQVVLGMAETLVTHGDELGESERRLLLDRTVANARKLHRLLDELLDLDRLNRGILEPVRRLTDLTALVRAVVEGVEGGADRPITVEVPPVTADLDGPKVERIVENLLRNALRHTEPGTPIWVKGEVVDGGILLAVEDAGPGVPAQLRGSIFEPFRRGDAPTTAGVGIGLSLVARFAELHSGWARVLDRPEGGARFEVFLAATVAPGGEREGADGGVTVEARRERA